MKQEVQIILTLEVDADKPKKILKNSFLIWKKHILELFQIEIDGSFLK